MAKSVFQQLAEYFDALGKRFTEKRTGQFVVFETYLLGEKMCKSMSQVCLDLDKANLSRTQTRDFVNKLRVLGKLIEKSIH